MMKKNKIAGFSQIFGVDLRSLAVFRMGLALVVLEDLISRSRALTAHYTDFGVLPRESWLNLSRTPWHWSIHGMSGHPALQVLLFSIAIGLALCLLVGYRTRLATIATWALLISLQNRNPLLIFAGDHVLRAVLFWAMFLPLGAYYSIDRALNSSAKPIPKWIYNGATFALIIQICYIYIWSAAFKTKSPMWWPDGEAVYYSLSFDQYATGFAQFLLSLPSSLLKLLTYKALIFEWIGPILLFIPFYNPFFRLLAIVCFILLHVGFALCFNIGSLSYLSIINWLALLPSIFWDKVALKMQTHARQELKVYYDEGCVFCRKLVHLLQTFFFLPDTCLYPYRQAKSVSELLGENHRWYVVEHLGTSYYQFEALVFVCRFSPILGWLYPLLRWPPIFLLGTKVYHFLASYPRWINGLTKPLQFRSLEIYSPKWLSVMAIFLLAIASIWNLKGFVDQTIARRKIQPDDWFSKTHNFLNRRPFQAIAWLPQFTRLDQIWSIFAPGAPRDDGWYAIKGKLEDGREVNAFQEAQPLYWEKPMLRQRSDFYQTIQWRVYFIELNRGGNQRLYPELARYICRQWNAKHLGQNRLQEVDIYFMDERTVPPDRPQTVTKKHLIHLTCAEEK
jgi:predicted DCC family thiol-disulfide oxidoreductase YuxK